MDTVFVALRVLLSLAAVVGLLWFLQRRITKGTRSSRASKLVTVVTRQGLAQKASVVVIDVEGTRFLLGVTEHSVTVLNSNELPVTVEAEVPEKTAGAAVFATALATAKATVTTRPADRAPIPFPQRIDPRTGMVRAPGAPGALDGSILSIATWKRAAAAMRASR